MIISAVPVAVSAVFVFALLILFIVVMMKTFVDADGTTGGGILFGGMIILGIVALIVGGIYKLCGR